MDSVAAPAVPLATAAAVTPAPLAPSAKPPLAKAPAVAAAPVPAIRPSPRPSQPMLVAVVRQCASGATPEIGEGDVDLPAPQPGRNWTIQIGAFADQTLANAQLANYAQHAQDVLARASRIVAPFQSADGHTMYRARFGLFAEREARDMCSRLTQRGQTCFAAVQTR